MRLKDVTIDDRIRCIEKFLNWIGRKPETATKLEIRTFLKEYGNDQYVKAIRVFFGKYLERPNLINTFKVPQSTFKPKHVPSKDELKLFFDELVTLKEKVIFLLLASSGLRFHEVMELHRCDVEITNNEWFFSFTP